MQKLVTFNEIRNNNLKTTALLLFFAGLVAAIGLLAGYYYGSPYGGVVMALVVGGIYALIAYHAGGNMICSLTHAKPADKLQYPHLVNSVEGLAIAAGIPAPKIYIIKDSALNAFATGKNPKHGVIVVTTGLLEKLNRQELEGVIAHEMAHIKHYDIRTMMVAAVIAGALVLLADILLRSVLWGGGKREKGSGLLIILGIVLAILSPIIAEIIRLTISRKREYAADAGAAMLTRYPQGLADALKKIRDDPDPLVDTANRATAHLFISTPFRKKKGVFTRMFATHPPIEDRIKRLEAM